MGEKWMLGCMVIGLLLVGCGSSDPAGDNGAEVQPVQGDATAPPEDTVQEYIDAGTPVVQACENDCFDGLFCTEDECVDGECVHTVSGDNCVLDGVCYGAYELHPTDPCLVCEPETADGWGAVPDGLTCEDADPCTPEDACVAGVCTGPQKPCDDGSECTDDSCSSETGVAECVHTANTELCDDDDPCTAEDTCDDKKCLGLPACDDGDACTNDFCGAEGECSTTPVICDDGNSCTTDSCDPGSGCEFIGVEDGSPCQGENYCLGGDTCVGEVCVDGTELISCGDDGNPCTDDNCIPSVGCVYSLNNDPCDDEFDCTVDDVCTASVCAGTPTEGCKACGTVSLGDTILKATVLLLGENGYPGEGLDVDGNPDTCSPVACSDGIDNALGVLSSIFNSALETSINSGQNAPLVELKNYNGNDTPFEIAIYNGVPDPAGGICDVMVDVCEYLILPGSLMPDCKATLSVENATLVGTSLTAGGPGTVLVMGLPLAPGEIQYVFIVGGRIEAQVEFGSDGTTIVGLDGVVAGAVPKDSLMESIQNVNQALFEPLTMQEVLDLVDVLVVEDIDLDGDGEFDAASVGIRISAIPGIVNGVQGE